MAAIKRQLCEHRGCTRRPSFGAPGTKKARWCKAHRHSGSEDVVSKQHCEHPGCKKRPSFSTDKKPRWCATHKPAGAEDVINRRCEHPGCTRVNPAFGFPGIDKRGRWCKAHGPDGTENVVSPRCEHPECKKQPTFGTDTKARWCGEHKPEGARDIINKLCEHPGCTTRSAFGGADKKPRWCAVHRPDDTNNVVSRRCEHPGCTILNPVFGVPGVDKRGRWCSVHRPSDAKDVANRRCEAPGCEVQTTGSHVYCASHDTERKRLTRVRENQVANFLRDAGLYWTAWNKQLSETACGRYRPDFLFELDTHAVVVEVDEHQHAKPGYACDNARMMDVFGSYGGVPIVFIRFNPDAFRIGGDTKRVTMKTRLKVLETQLRESLARPPARQLTIVRLFYDHATATVATTWVAPDDPTFAELEV